MKLEFFKYQGTGNDFIITSDSDFIKKADKKTVSFLCDRRLGIGADGLIILEKDKNVDFRMTYFNSDGKESTMCGNGGRCAVAHAYYLDWVKKNCKFLAIDGGHTGKVIGDEIEISMINPGNVESWKNAFWIDTGSPHLVIFLSESHSLWDYDIYREGKKFRNEKDFQPDGVNVNFVKKTGEKKLQLRTYERGVENETLSCGTGNVAAACVAAIIDDKEGKHQFEMINKGGTLKIEFVKNKNQISKVKLTGAAKQVFKGVIDI